MTMPAISTPIVSTGTRPWPLELEAEVAEGFRQMLTEKRMRSIAWSLERLDGVRAVTVSAHSETNLLCVRLTVDGRDFADAVERAIALVRACASYPDLGNLVLVAARVARLAGS